MPRYFFDVNDGSEIADHRGVELVDGTEARHRAVSVAAEFVKMPTVLSGNAGAVVVTVRDGAGAVVAIARLVLSVEAA